ncbi:hypothetical protein SBOR_8386 [Sclerotinia borealis F-4128]|uniref:Glycine-rich cell wall structural protein 1 n=1 Tax=Sclerotinia borealis (strain F-4128) TaxID=1432307 RepID=W9C9J5_SCLBF|nr:hypothetical protein SBOR_8386 [Sclerotinia borealis F-4128]
METVNNLAAAASKAIWGETESQETTEAAKGTVVPETQGTEPVSGVLGDTAKGEPFDGGNMDSTSTENTVPKKINDPSVTASSSGHGAKSLDPSSTTHPSSSTGLPAKTIADTNIAPLDDNNIHTGTSTSTTDSGSSSSFKTTDEKPLISDKINPNLPSSTSTYATTDRTAQEQLNPSTSTTLPIRSEYKTDKTGVTGAHGTGTALGTQTQDIKPSSSVERGATLGDHSGSGIAAGEKDLTSTKTNKPSSTANTQGVKTDLKPLSSEQNKVVEEEEGVEGSGEKYIKSTGVVAEGGDFDATRPGAGREADRLMGKEGKVEKSDAGVSGGTVGGVGGVGGVGEDTSGVRKSISSEEGEGKKEGKLTHLKEKIKEKLHKH